ARKPLVSLRRRARFRSTVLPLLARVIVAFPDQMRPRAYLLFMCSTYLLAIVLVSTMVPRRLRLRLVDLWLLRWRLLAMARLSLPVAVTRNRFLDALWLFILGMAALPLRPASPPSK